MVLLGVQREGPDVARGHVSTGGGAGPAGERQAGANPAEEDGGGQETGESRPHLPAGKFIRNQKKKGIDAER